MNRKKIQTFNDGVLTICNISSNEELLIEAYPTLRFENRTVGAERFFKAKEIQHTISRVVRIPYVNNIEDDYVVIINNSQYNIMQMQTINDTFPPCWQLSLEKRKRRLELKKEND